MGGNRSQLPRIGACAPPALIQLAESPSLSGRISWDRLGRAYSNTSICTENLFGRRIHCATSQGAFGQNRLSEAMFLREAQPDGTSLATLALLACDPLSLFALSLESRAPRGRGVDFIVPRWPSLFQRGTGRKRTDGEGARFSKKSR